MSTLRKTIYNVGRYNKKEKLEVYSFYGGSEYGTMLNLGLDYPSGYVELTLNNAIELRDSLTEWIAEQTERRNTNETTL